MYGNKAVIGIVGGIGSGKSRIAALFGELGCLIVDADAAVRELYGSAAIRRRLRQWWGDEILTPDGQVDRAAVGRKVFADPVQRRRLEGLLHPLVAAKQRAAMAAAVGKARVKAFVWDIPLLVETGQDQQCDAVVFVDAPLKMRAQRVLAQRGWSRRQLLQREKLQLPLDKKRSIADHVVRNIADASYVRSQVREIFSRILADLPGRL